MKRNHLLVLLSLTLLALAISGIGPHDRTDESDQTFLQPDLGRQSGLLNHRDHQKGISYAVFPAVSGSYTAIYAP